MSEKTTKVKNEAINKTTTKEPKIDSVRNTFETFFELSIDMLCIANTGGRFEKINTAFTRVLGWTQQELLSKSMLEYVHKDDLRNTYKTMGTLFLGDQVINFENRYLCKNGEYKWLSWNLKPFDQGLIFGSARDITREKEIDRMKTEFISIASHQLRTPLSSLRWYTEILTDHAYKKLEPKEQKYLMNIKSSNMRMIQLVGTLLNISRIESGRLIVDPEEVDLESLINALLEDLVLKVKGRRQNIILDYRAKQHRFNLDENIMRNILMNLLTNANKYSPEETEIFIRVEERDTRLIIQIIDHGYGIPAEDHEKVFTKFFRSKNVVELVTEGAGLGLYLVKELTEMVGGEISFISEPNKGSTFSISLPITGMVEKSGEAILGV